jgi:signal transduction histidine kinase
MMGLQQKSVSSDFSMKMLQRLLSDSDLATALSDMLTYVQSLLPKSCHAMILVHRPELGGLIREATTPVSFYPAEIQNPIPLRPDSTPAGRAAFFKTPIFCPDLRQEPLWGPYLAKKEPTLTAVWAFPILNADREVLGTFSFYYSEVLNSKPLQDEALFRTLIQLAGITLERHRSKRQAEQLLAEMQKYQERLNLAISSRRMGVWDWNVQEDRLIWDDTMFEIYGLSKEQFVGDISDWVRCVPPEDAHTTFELIDRVFRHRNEFDHQFRVIKNGEVRHMKAVGLIIQNEDGEIVRMTGLNWDVTEKMLVTKRLEQERAKAIASSKMAALGEMASGLAHEINNPLTIILNRASQLRARIERDHFDPASALSELEKIENTVERIAKIIRGLRAFSRNADSDPMISCHVETVIRDTLELCTERMKKEGIELRMNGPFEDWHIHARPSQISQVLLNLLNNSIDAIRTMTQPWIEIRVTKIKTDLEIRVTDSGHGIPAHIASRMMEPFFTTKEVGRGTGLGLAISRGILEDHRGRLFYDEDSENTCFAMTLPLELPLEQPSPRPGKVLARPARQITKKKNPELQSNSGFSKQDEILF